MVSVVLEQILDLGEFRGFTWWGGALLQAREGSLEEMTPHLRLKGQIGISEVSKEFRT